MNIPASWAQPLLGVAFEEEPTRFWRLVADLLYRLAPHRVSVVWSNQATIVSVRDEHGGLAPPTDDVGLAQRLRSGSLYNEVGTDGYMAPVAKIDTVTLRATSQGSEPLLRRLGCDHAHTLAFFNDLNPNWIQVSIVLYGSALDAAVEPPPYAQLEQLQPLLRPLVSRHMNRLQSASFHAGVTDFLRDLPVGLVFANWQQDVVFVNDEGYRQAHRWNSAPQTRRVKDAKERFAIAPDLQSAWTRLRQEWIDSVQRLAPMAQTSLTVTHERVPTLKAVVSIVLDPTQPLTTPNFVIRYAGVGDGAANAAFEPSSVQLSVLSQLTPAERSVAVLVMQGLDNQAIAEKLHRQVSTVKDHLTHVYAKLGLRSRAQLASLAQMR